MIASGITTVQHLQGGLPGDAAAVKVGVGDVIRAHEDVGMRVSHFLMLREIIREPLKPFALARRPRANAHGIGDRRVSFSGFTVAASQRPATLPSEPPPR